MGPQEVTEGSQVISSSHTRSLQGHRWSQKIPRKSWEVPVGSHEIPSDPAWSQGVP